MFDSELNSFLFKFHQLRKTGATAHLDLDTHAGQAWVMLVPIQHSPAPSQRHRSPSYFRQQERRRAARQASDESDKVVAEDAATERNDATRTPTIQKNAEEASTNDKVSNCVIPL